MPLFLFACAPLPSVAAKNAPQKTANTNVSISHSTCTSSFPDARNSTKPSIDEVAWLKAQADSNQQKLVQPKKVVIQPKLVKLLKNKKTFQLNVITPTAEDSCLIDVRFLGARGPLYSVQTKHETCPAWIEMVINQAAQRVVIEAKSRQRKTIGGCTAVVAGVCLVAYKNHLDAEAAHQEERVRQEAERIRQEQAAKQDAARELEEAAAAGRAAETKIAAAAEIQAAQRRATEESAHAAARLPDSILTRYEEEPERTSTNTSLVRYKTLLTTTPFFNFTIGSIRERIPVCKGLQPPQDEKRMRQLCNAYPFAYLNPDNKCDLTPDQYHEFLSGCFKETTIDFLAQFERNFQAGRAQDIEYAARGRIDSSEVTNDKEVALEGFIDRLTKLQTNDPIEAKRIFCFHPNLVECMLLLNNNRFHIGEEPGPKEEDPRRFPCFGSVLRHSLAGKYCLKDLFPNHISVFRDLHLVNAATH